ncbi:helix-turn-helix domain-containing protein [Paenibacillus sp. FSL R5-0407]|uniref:helix-turn-helix domain-containing protein n=1 Tax=Paenibacillus sp. FSL R5-0407 TaxID=2975320 RepID=UPI0030FCBD53
MDGEHCITFEHLLGKLLQSELSQLINKLRQPALTTRKKYLTISEVSELTGVGTYTLRQLTFARAMPHRKLKARIIFDQTEITETIEKYKKLGWNDPENEWDVPKIQLQIASLHKKKEETPLIEDIIRKLIKEELESFSKEIASLTKKDKERYYGRTVLTIKEAAEHFRTSPSTIYSLVKDEGMPHLKIQSRFYVVLEEAEAYLWRETAKSYATTGNVYWQRILQRLDWEETERNEAYGRALKRLEERTY